MGLRHDRAPSVWKHLHASRYTMKAGTLGWCMHEGVHDDAAGPTLWGKLPNRFWNCPLAPSMVTAFID